MGASGAPRQAMFDVIAFDADDTLWHTEHLYSAGLGRLRRILERHGCGEGWEPVEHEIEVGNLRYYGYGIKGFVLSLMETAITLTGGQVTSGEIRELIDLAKEMATAEVELVEHAEDVVAALAASYPLMLVTKGDLFDQEAKLERSGLARHFRYVEIVSDKTCEQYAALFAKYRLEPARFLMVGNSLRSDVLPVIGLGGRAVHVPYAGPTWAHEDAEPTPDERARYYELERLQQLPGLIDALSRAPQ